MILCGDFNINLRNGVEDATDGIEKGDFLLVMRRAKLLYFVMKKGRWSRVQEHIFEGILAEREITGWCPFNRLSSKSGRQCPEYIKSSEMSQNLMSCTSNATTGSCSLVSLAVSKLQLEGRPAAFFVMSFWLDQSLSKAPKLAGKILDELRHQTKMAEPEPGTGHQRDPESKVWFSGSNL